MGLIDYNQVPFCHLELLLKRLIPCQLIQPDDAQIYLFKDIPAYSRFKPVIGENFKFQMELAVKLILPLFRKASRRYDQASLKIAADD